MEIRVYTDNKNASSWFGKIEKSKTTSLAILPLSGFKKEIPCLPRHCIVYLDFTGITDALIKKNLKMLNSSERIFGVIDSQKDSKDQSIYFHEGASDFVGKSFLKDCLTPQRMKKVYEYGSRFFAEEQEEEIPVEERYDVDLSGKDWSSVKTGKEYIFTFMMIELDNKKDIKKRFSGQSIDVISKEIHDFLNKTFSPAEGKLWMWNDLTALFLFPFDGKECPAIFTAFEMLLNRKISSFEEFDHDMLFSYKISMHIGCTTYHSRGQTGKIVSDSINSIHHLSSKFAKAGAINITEDVMPFRPGIFEDKFIELGEYEGRKIYRMLNVV